MRRDRKRYDWENDLREDRAYARRIGWSAARWAIVVTAGVLVLSAVIFFLTVVVSGPKGAGEQRIITNDGRNRVNSQEMFNDLYQQIISLDRRLTTSAESLAVAKTDEDKAYWRSTLTGQSNRCLEVVGNYNSEVRKVSRAKWRDTDLPYTIDATDPTTDCQPATPTPKVTP